MSQSAFRPRLPEFREKLLRRGKRLRRNAHVAGIGIAEQQHEIQAHHDEERHERGHAEMNRVAVDREQKGEEQRDDRAGDQDDPFGSGNAVIGRPRPLAARLPRIDQFGRQIGEKRLLILGLGFDVKPLLQQGREQVARLLAFLVVLHQVPFDRHDLFDVAVDQFLDFRLLLGKLLREHVDGEKRFGLGFDRFFGALILAERIEDDKAEQDGVKGADDGKIIAADLVALPYLLLSHQSLDEQLAKDDGGDGEEDQRNADREVVDRQVVGHRRSNRLFQ